jgi:hypothetical protein
VDVTWRFDGRARQVLSVGLGDKFITTGTDEIGEGVSTVNLITTNAHNRTDVWALHFDDTGAGELRITRIEP